MRLLAKPVAHQLKRGTKVYAVCEVDNDFMLEERVLIEVGHKRLRVNKSFTNWPTVYYAADVVGWEFFLTQEEAVDAIVKGCEAGIDNARKAIRAGEDKLQHYNAELPRAIAWAAQWAEASMKPMKAKEQP